MSCKCFNTTPPNGSLPFKERLVKSKCACNARFLVSEKRSKFYIEPHDLDSIDKIKVDDFLITSKTTKKCDYLFIYKEKHTENNIDKYVEKTYIFTELKGCGIETALQQIDETIKIFINEKGIENPLDTDIRGFIVFTSYPKDSGSYRKAKRNIEKIYRKKFSSFRINQLEKEMTYNCIEDK